jgi:hypothetical protein
MTRAIFSPGKSRMNWRRIGSNRFTMTGRLPIWPPQRLFGENVSMRFLLWEKIYPKQ